MRQSSFSSIARSRALALMLLGLGATLCYGGALARFPLLEIYARPIQNLAKLTSQDSWIGLALAIGVVSLFAGYGAGALMLSNARADYAGRRAPAWLSVMLIAFPLLFMLVLALVYPTTSLDLYDYVFRGRMLARYSANTFVKTPIDFQSDPLFWYTAWRRSVTAYGPLWEGLSWLTARLAGETHVYPSGGAARDADLLRLMLAYKALAGVGFLFCAASIWFTLRRSAPEYRWLGLYLWLWNPLALWESLAAGHNDAWMAALIVLAVGAMSAKQGDRETGRLGARERVSARLPISALADVASLLLLTTGGLVKYLALMFGPLLLSAALRRQPGWRARLWLALGGGLACLALVTLAYRPVWVGWPTLRNFGDRGTLFTSSWLAVLQGRITLAELKRLVPAESLLALVVPAGRSQPLAVAIGLALLAFGTLWAAWRAWRVPEDIARHALWLLLWFLFLCNPWFQPWYLLWALALLAIQPWRSGAARVIGVFCCTAMLSYLGGVFLLPALGWDAEGAEWNLLTSALIYIPPLLTLLWGRRLVAVRSWSFGRLTRSLAAREKA